MNTASREPTPTAGDAPPLHYRLDGAGPAVVMLHPVGLDLTVFDALAFELARNFTVLRVDLRGHGRSPWQSPGPSLETYADDVHAVLVRLDFTPAAIVGFSFGGMVAQVLALTHPGDVSALVISACASTLSDEGRRVLASRGAAAEQDGMQAVVDVTLKRWFSDAFRARGGDQWVRDRLLTIDPRSWADAWRAMSAIHTAPRLTEITVPTLCLAGEADVSAPPNTVRAIASGISRATFNIIPAAPHMLFIEQDQAVAAVLTAFLQTHARE
jgi:3-oxoadipate enol-lactonase